MASNAINETHVAIIDPREPERIKVAPAVMKIKPLQDIDRGLLINLFREKINKIDASIPA
jgi:hypothetical protein